MLKTFQVCNALCNLQGRGYIISLAAQPRVPRRPAAARLVRSPPDAHTAAHLSGCPVRRPPRMRAPLMPSPRQHSTPDAPPTHFCCLTPAPGNNIYGSALYIASLATQPTPYTGGPIARVRLANCRILMSALLRLQPFDDLQQRSRPRPPAPASGAAIYIPQPH